MIGKSHGSDSLRLAALVRQDCEPAGFPRQSVTAKLIAGAPLYSVANGLARGANCRAVCPPRHFRLLVGLI